jgi:hypothetical protein
MVTPSQIVTIARSTAGPATDAAEAAAVFAIIGTAADGPEDDAPYLARNDRDPTSRYVGGPLVEAAEIVMSYSGMSTILVRATSAAPGAYGSLDDDDFTGTAVPSVDATYIPYVDGELYVIFDTGGDLGDAEASITYRVSPDGGRTFGAARSLGAGTTIADSTLHARIVFSVPEDELVDLVNDIRTQVLAHFAMGSGTHNSADATSGAGVGSAATDETTAIARINQIRAAVLLHAANATAHNSADTTSFASLPAAATDGPTAVALANAIKAAYGVHRINATVHDAADSTNVVTEPNATPGTIEEGDILQVATTGPTMDAAGLAAAFDALLLEYNGSLFGGVAVVGAFTPSTHWTALINGLDALRENHIPVIGVIEARLPTTGETPAAYRASLEAAWDAYEDERVYRCAGDLRYDPATLARCVAQFRRTKLAPFVARLAALDFGESPGVTKLSQRTLGRPSAFGGPLAGVRIYDDAGNRIGHDERVNPGLNAAGFGVVTSYTRVSSRTAAYVFEPKTAAPEGNTAPHITHQRIASVVEGLIYEIGTDNVQSRLLIEPERATLRDDVADGLDAEFRNRILDVTGDPDVSTSARVSSLSVLVDRNAEIDPDDSIIPVNVDLETPRYTSSFQVTLRVNGGG